jgi:hypothetical protein
MAINVAAIGATGTHTFTKTNINIDENFLYYNSPTQAGVTTLIPSGLADGVGLIYRSGVGAINGLTTNTLYFINRLDNNSVQFEATDGGVAVDLSAPTAGSVTFNTPTVFNNILNIDASTATNQAVKYYTNGTPLTGLTSGNTYFLKNVSASSFAGAQALYTVASNTHTFTTCGQTGRVGPTQAQMRSAYSTTWDETYLSQGDFQGYQDWVVPVSGIYEFTVAGASGNNGSGSGSVGRGAIVKGRVPLTKGEIITIAVGQVGAASSNAPWGGAGGGTFVVRKTGDEPLFVAGGGAGEPNVGAGRDGVLTQLGGRSTNNAIAGGAAGFGGVASGGISGAGGGFFSRGQNGLDLGGGSFLDGLTQGVPSRVGGAGGFGGGGQSDGTNIGQSGGGGGYSGGGGARSGVSNHSGGGGGSFITSVATNVATSTGLWEAQLQLT